MAKDDGSARTDLPKPVLSYRSPADRQPWPNADRLLLAANGIYVAVNIVGTGIALGGTALPSYGVLAFFTVIGPAVLGLLVGCIAFLVKPCPFSSPALVMFSVAMVMMVLLNLAVLQAALVGSA